MALPSVLVLNRVVCRNLYDLLPLQELADGSRRCAFVRNRRWNIECMVHGRYSSADLHSFVSTIRLRTKIVKPDGSYIPYQFPDLTVSPNITVAEGDGRWYKSVPDFDWRVGIVREAGDLSSHEGEATIVQFIGREQYFRFIGTTTVTQE